MRTAVTATHRSMSCWMALLLLLPLWSATITAAWTCSSAPDRRTTAASAAGIGGEKRGTTTTNTCLWMTETNSDKKEQQTTKSAAGAAKNNDENSNVDTPPFDLLHSNNHQNKKEHPNQIINQELAERIYSWEQEHRITEKQLPPIVHFSVRAGIRLVDEIVRDALLQSDIQQPAATTADNNDQQQQQKQQRWSSVLYSDLVQEGLEALLEAMSQYPNEDSSGFKEYATQRIQTAVSHTLEQELLLTSTSSSSSSSSSSSRRQSSFSSLMSADDLLPSPVRALIQDIRTVMEQFKEQRELEDNNNNNKERRPEENKKKPTLKQLARVLRDEYGHDELTVARLQECLRMAFAAQQQTKHKNNNPQQQPRRFPRQAVLSVESTVEISHPMLEDGAPRFMDRDQWEVNQGLLLDTYHEGEMRRRNRRNRLNQSDNKNNNNNNQEEGILVQDFLDEMMDREGDDDAWIQQQEQVAGTLQELIPDTEEYYTTKTSSTTVTARQRQQRKTAATTDAKEASSSAAAEATEWGTDAEEEEEENGIVLSSHDDDALVDMIRHDLSNFLTSTLEPQEVKIVRLAFGLDSGRPMSIENIAATAAASEAKEHYQDIPLDAKQISSLLARSIQKLRQAYTSRYIEPYLEDDPTTDSV